MAESLWNEESPLVQIIGMEYERDYLHLWDSNRVAKLARDMGVTIFVLCAQVGCFRTVYKSGHDLVRLQFDRKTISQSWNRNLWPMSMILQFERLEKFMQARQREHREKGELIGIATADRITAKVLAGTLATSG